MKIISTIAAMLGAAALATCTQVSVSYDFTYDDPANPLTLVACSDGEHGMMTKYGFQTIGEIPCDVASSSTVGGWNSDTCGACYELTYEGESIRVLAIDSKPDGIDLSQKAMDRLTRGQAVQLGRVTAELQQVGLDRCNLIGRRGVAFTA